MWWHRRVVGFDPPAGEDPLGPHRWRAWGQTPGMVASWLAWVPGVVLTDIVWTSPGDVASLVALLALNGLEALDVRAGVDSHLRWSREGRLHVRAPREAPWWPAWRRRFADDANVQAQTLWQQGHRRHRAWLGPTVAGLEFVDGRGYREWTLAGPALAAAALREWLPLFPVRRLEARVSGTRAAVWDRVGEPARVQRWEVQWSGPSLPLEPPPALEPSWHARWRYGRDGEGNELWVEHTATCGQPTVTRWALRRDLGDGAVGLRRMMRAVRRVAREIPPGVDWWSADAAPTDFRRLYGEWARRGEAFAEAARRMPPGLSEAGVSLRDVWWVGWAAVDPATWWASHPDWPDRALVTWHAPQGPYPARLEVRWGWHGPRWSWTGVSTRAEALRRLAASREALEAWWGALAAAEATAVSAWPGAPLAP
jgi:hypothetical protein